MIFKNYLTYNFVVVRKDNIQKDAYYDRQLNTYKKVQVEHMLQPSNMYIRYVLCYVVHAIESYFRLRLPKIREK